MNLSESAAAAPTGEAVAAPVPVIAIDGPTASGKGTVAGRVARALGFDYLDSGALYRLVGLAALNDEVGFDDEAALAVIARRLAPRFDDNRIWLDGVDVTGAIRREEVGAAASRVAVHPAVRTALLHWQRDRRVAPGLVADGRDMGTVVFPDAAAKVYLTASVKARAERRYKQLIDNGLSANIADLLRDLRERDMRDASRAAAPLRSAHDALLIDSSALTIDEVVERVLRWYRSKAAFA